MTTNIYPKVAIIVLHYRESASPYVRQCLDSAIGQTYHNLEIIFSDNDSPINLDELKNDYPQVKFYRNPRNIGMFGNCRHAVEHYTNADYCIFLCDDDFFSDNHYIEDAVSLVVAKGVSVAFSGIHVLNEGSGVVRKITYRLPRVMNGNDLCKMFWTSVEGVYVDIPWITVFFNRRQFLDRKILASNQDLMTNDYVFALSNIVGAQVGYVPRACVCYREHAQSFSNIEAKLDLKKFFQNILDNGRFLDVLPEVFLKNGISEKDVCVWKKRVAHQYIVNKYITLTRRGCFSFKMFRKECFFQLNSKSTALYLKGIFKVVTAYLKSKLGTYYVYFQKPLRGHVT